MSSKQNTVTGYIVLKRDFGFVAPENATGGDYFIPPGCTGGAMSGDRVEARVDHRRGETVGVVVKILERNTKQIVGTLDRRGNTIYLVCEQATEPMRVDAAESGVKQKDLRPGWKAVGSITNYSTGFGPGTVTVSQVLGEAGDPNVEAVASRISFSVPHDFPKGVLSEVNRFDPEISQAEIDARTDLRELDIFTIDPEDARDFDDAISIEANGSGHKVGVHIADVSHFVKEGTALDEEAFRRGTSTYLPGEVIPMLPDRLSNNLCSLVEGEDRLCSTVFIDFNAAHEPSGFSHCRSIIRSKRRFTYPEVDIILEAGKGEFAGELAQLCRIAKKLFAIREGRGAVDFNLPEDKPILDTNGKVTGIRRIERTWSHRLIEELMILTNEYAARALGEKGIYRVHDEPSPEKLRGLRNFLTVFGFGMRGRSLPEIVKCFEGKPSQPVVEKMILRTMQEAKYSHENTGHFGLASKAYSHFTSPIRRYPDLIAHRLLHREKVSRPLNTVAAQCSRRERAAMEAERDALDIKFLEYAAQQLGDPVTGTIDTVTRDGVFVSLDIGPRGYLHTLELGREQFKFVKDEAALIGRTTGRRFRVGDRIEATIGSVNISERRLWLSMSGGTGASRASSADSPWQRQKGGKSDRGAKARKNGGGGRGRTSKGRRGGRGGGSGRGGRSGGGSGGGKRR